MAFLCLSPLNYCTLRVHRAWNELVVFRTSFLVAVDRADTAFARRLCGGRWRSVERAAKPRHNLCVCPGAQACVCVCVCVCAGVRLCGRATPSRRCWPPRGRVLHTIAGPCRRVKVDAYQCVACRTLSSGRRLCAISCADGSGCCRVPARGQHEAAHHRAAPLTWGMSWVNVHGEKVSYFCQCVVRALVQASCLWMCGCVFC